jgi:hypothetical protein
MPDLKLPKLPDRTPVKLTISITPDLQRTLQDYARCYADVYGTEESVVELIPHMLAAFLTGDRGFARARETTGERGR